MLILLSEMGSDQSGDAELTPTPADPIEAFCDSNILLNYLNQEWERERGAKLVRADSVLIIIPARVKEEIEEVVDRRHEVYTAFVEFTLKEDGDIEDFSYDGRLVGNDGRHIRELQMELAKGDRRESLMRLREFAMQYRQRGTQLLSDYVEEVIQTAAPFMFEMELKRVIPNSADAAIVAGAADWTSQGGSGLLVTDDRKDIVDLTEEINEVINEHLGPETVLVIRTSAEIEPEESAKDTA